MVLEVLNGAKDCPEDIAKASVFPVADAIAKLRIGLTASGSYLVSSWLTDGAAVLTKYALLKFLDVDVQYLGVIADMPSTLARLAAKSFISSSEGTYQSLFPLTVAVSTICAIPPTDDAIMAFVLLCPDPTALEVVRLLQLLSST